MSALRPPLNNEQSTKSTMSAYAHILDDFPSDGGGPPQRQWSIRQANSRLDQHGLQSALESDLNLQYQGNNALQQQQEEEKAGIPMTVLSSPTSPQRQSNNPYLSSPPMSPTSRNLKHKTYGFDDPFAEAPMEAWQEMKDYNLRANGLPTLDQMMRLRTLTPLTQSNFTAFLRRRGVHQNFNFLLELDTHDKLWHAHVQSLRRQTRSSADRLSRFLESAAEKPANTKDTMMMMYDPNHHHHHQGSNYVETPDTQDLLRQQQYFPSTEEDIGHSTATAMGSNNNHSTTTSPYASRSPNGKSLGRHDLEQNATRIYRTFCSRLDAAQPIHLPDDHRAVLDELIEKHHRPEPIVFESARSHVFEILNVFYYPQFVDTVLYSNLAQTSARIVFLFGLIFLTIGFAVELSLIFLDQGTMGTRWWAILPFFFGWTNLLAGITDFAWWLAFTGKSEINFFAFEPIQDKTVLRIHRKRAIIWLAATIVLAILSSIIFVFIPGTRLRSA
ncbi:hypothetical protein BDB00DRAFT_825984 [Zychaea mexicana]|uniref:uncharacterized protein n=1 Tax=Zychaea mexicana TaxID=64656 RepID=UPI0022FE141D|nr:uncharacterized protein BDB00DRAFT_825984 [Zychaea mexicana]KAI9492887.1 hypothetical protein BDB00DRAFT_825984 [Zychaea mexicana]